MEEEKSSGWGTVFLLALVALGTVAVIAAILIPNFIRHRDPYGPYRACQYNVKNLGTAMEVYSMDWNNTYPPGNKPYLTPNYLKTIPECPSAGSDTYVFERGPSATYNTQSHEDYYFVYCRGNNHANVSISANYPQYNSIVGLIQR